MTVMSFSAHNLTYYTDVIIVSSIREIRWRGKVAGRCNKNNKFNRGINIF